MEAAVDLKFQDFCKAMVSFARRLQGKNYPGDDYYMQDCWRDYWEDGDSPADAVVSDMSYWESSSIG